MMSLTHFCPLQSVAHRVSLQCRKERENILSHMLWIFLSRHVARLHACAEHELFNKTHWWSKWPYPTFMFITDYKGSSHIHIQLWLTWLSIVFFCLSDSFYFFCSLLELVFCFCLRKKNIMGCIIRIVVFLHQID